MPQDVVRDQRAFDQRVAGLDVVAGVDQQVLVVRHVVLRLHAGLAADDDGHLAAALVGPELDARRRSRP